jgi:hypothetical protein
MLGLEDPMLHALNMDMDGYRQGQGLEQEE